MLAVNRKALIQNMVKITTKVIKMKKFSTCRKALSKTFLMVIVAVIAIAVVGSAAAIYLTQNPSTPNTTATPPASTNPSESSTPAPSASTGNGIATATSLQFSVNLIENGVPQGVYTFLGKNIGSSSSMLRVDCNEGEYSDNTIYIFNGVQHKAWKGSGNEWEDLSTYYDQEYETWNNLWKSYVGNLTAWTGTGGYSYTQNGLTVNFHDIQVNPELADSLFEHT
ncbi:MAG: hypothetical protein NWE93_05100 [Candidatus Bathyarchaeota archaeon]|nr:hypothetical protein [Candidatus Bathyarchaeota archaeon]